MGKTVSWRRPGSVDGIENAVYGETSSRHCPLDTYAAEASCSSGKNGLAVLKTEGKRQQRQEIVENVGTATAVPTSFCGC